MVEGVARECFRQGGESMVTYRSARLIIVLHCDSVCSVKRYIRCEVMEILRSCGRSITCEDARDSVHKMWACPILNTKLTMTST